jgi:hypothetical protein
VVRSRAYSGVSGRKKEIVMWLKTVGPIVMLALGILAAPLATDAQPPGTVYHIGVLETIPMALNAANFDAFR